MSPKVSIVLPTHNRRELVQRTIGSILAQTRKDWELIVVDDASEDGTAEVLDAISDPRVTVVHNERNLKLPGALNVGHGKARGEMLTWVSDDCWVDEDWLAPMVDCLDAANRSYGVVFTPYVCHWPDGKTERQHVGLASLKSNNGVGASFLYRADLYRECGGYDESLVGVEDWEFWLRMAQRCKFKCLSTCCSYHYLHSLKDSMTVTMRQEIARLLKTVHDRYANATMFYEPGYVDLSVVMLCPEMSAARFQLWRSTNGPLTREFGVECVVGCRREVGAGAKRVEVADGSLRSWRRLTEAVRGGIVLVGHPHVWLSSQLRDCVYDTVEDGAGLMVGCEVVDDRLHHGALGLRSEIDWTPGLCMAMALADWKDALNRCREGDDVLTQVYIDRAGVLIHRQDVPVWRSREATWS